MREPVFRRLRALKMPKFRTKLSRIRLPLLASVAKNQKIRMGVVAMASAAAVMTLGWLVWSNSSLSRISASVAVTDGTLEYRVANDHPWERARAGMSFGEGAQLRTDNNSRASIRIADGSEVRLNSNTTIVLVDLTRQNILVENAGGDMYARVSDAGGRTFQVRTNAAHYQSKAAAYRVIRTDDKAGTEVYCGAIEISGEGQSTITVGQGERYFATNTAATDLEGKTTRLVQTELSADSFLQWNSEQDRKRFPNTMGVLNDITPPSLEITEPSNGFITTETSIAIKGAAEKGTVVLVNSVGVENSGGAYEKTINLNIGENPVTVEASDATGNKTTKTLIVTRAEPVFFRLTATPTDKGVALAWEISGISVTQGFKVLMSKDTNPTYDKNKADATVDATARNYTWKITDGNTYHFRVCSFDGETCANYSDDATATAPTKQVNSWFWPGYDD